MLAWKLDRFRDCTCFAAFLKVFLCGTLSAPRNAGLVFSYGSNGSKSRRFSEVLWRIEVCKIFLLQNEPIPLICSRAQEFLLLPVLFRSKRTNFYQILKLFPIILLSARKSSFHRLR